MRASYGKMALVVLVGAALTAVGTASADPVGGRGVLGLKLIIIDKYFKAGKAKLVFVAKDRTAGAIHKGLSGDPPNLTGTVEVFRMADPSNVAVYDLPETGDNHTGTWLVNKDTVAKYVNKGAAAGTSGVKVTVVKPDKVLKVVAKNLGDGDSATGDQGPTDFDPAPVTVGDTIRVRVTINNANVPADTHVMCSDFIVQKVKQIAADTGYKVVSKDSVAPADGTCGTVATTSTTTSTSTTSTTIGSAMGAILEFVTSDPDLGTPSGVTKNGGSAGTVLKTLHVGGLNLGGGCYQNGGSCGIQEGGTPGGSSNLFNAECTASSCTISARTAAQTGSSRNCSDTGCSFGTYLPIANTATSTCVQNVFAAPGSGTLNLTDAPAGRFTGSVPLTSKTTLTGNGTNPCPLCLGGTPLVVDSGTCDSSWTDSSSNPSSTSGAACTPTDSAGDTYDCVPFGADLGGLSVDLTPFDSGTVSVDTSGSGDFCGQGATEPGSFGCFASTKLNSVCNGGTDNGSHCSGNPPNPLTDPCLSGGGTCDPMICDYIEETGVDAAGISVGGGPVSAQLVSVFCVPPVGGIFGGLINGAADLPGPGATALPGSLELN